MPDIIVNVAGGIVQSVANLPPGTRIIVRDFDSAEDIDKLHDPLPDGFKRDGDSASDVYQEFIFEAE